MNKQSHKRDNQLQSLKRSQKYIHSRLGTIAVQRYQSSPIGPPVDSDSVTPLCMWMILSCWLSWRSWPSAGESGYQGLSWASAKFSCEFFLVHPFQKWAGQLWIISLKTKLWIKWHGWDLEPLTYLTSTFFNSFLSTRDKFESQDAKLNFTVLNHWVL